MLLLAALLAVPIAYRMLNPAKRKAEEVQGRCNQKYCPPTYQIYVDRALNTTLRDDRPAVSAGMTIDQGLRAAHSKMMATLAQETANHPGVRLVAHAIQ
jgi:hypothetical protein